MAQSSTEPMAVSYYIRECGAILLGALSATLLLALISYAPIQASAENVTSNFNNLIGTIGNSVAFASYWAFGVIAYLIPLGLLGGCVMALLRRESYPDWSVVSRLAGGGMLFVFAASILAALHIPGFALFPHGAGGVMGEMLVAYTIDFVNTPGLSILAFAGMLISVQLIFQFSWLKVLELIGRSLVSTYGWLKLASQWLARGTQATYIGVCALTSRVFALLRWHGQPKESIARTRISPIVSYEEEASRPKQSAATPSPRGAAHSSKTQPQETRIAPTVLAGLPSLEILASSSRDSERHEAEQQSLIALGERLRMILSDYGVAIEVESIISGPVVSRFEIQLAPGLKVNKIVSLANDLAREIAVRSVRVVPVIPGKSVVGIEIPNRNRATVTLRDVLAAKEFNAAKQPLTLALGKDIAGEPVYADLERMPHLLVAGTTGSGKSVGVNAMLLSLLYRLTPEDVRLILVDPKMLELSVYADIPHLLAPVVTDMQDAAKALQWCVSEMERRYRLMMELKVRNLGGYNEKLAEAERAGEVIVDPLWEPESGEEQQALSKLPLIVVVIDEFADMIMIVGKKIEQLIARIAQKARAAGIHLILATQRPSVDVITGLIKANIPCRISYQVSSQVDSRTILDQVGAEQLLGHGDMLYLAPGSSVPERVHGAFVSDEEVLAVIEDWRQRGEPDYVYDVVSDNIAFDPAELGLANFGEDGDDLFQEAVRFVIESRRASASALQTKFQIGWNKASRYMDQMEQQGIVTEPDHKGRREVVAAED